MFFLSGMGEKAEIQSEIGGKMKIRSEKGKTKIFE